MAVVVALRVPIAYRTGAGRRIVTISNGVIQMVEQNYSKKKMLAGEKVILTMARKKESHHHGFDVVSY